MRVDACVNYANTLSSWAAVESAQGAAGKASELLIAAVEGCRRALEQEEDAAVSPPQCHTELFSFSSSACSAAALTGERELLLPSKCFTWTRGCSKISSEQNRCLSLTGSLQPRTQLRFRRGP